MKSDALNHFKAEMEKRGLFRKIQVCATLIPPPAGPGQPRPLQGRSEYRKDALRKNFRGASFL